MLYIQVGRSTCGEKSYNGLILYIFIGPFKDMMLCKTGKNAQFLWKYQQCRRLLKSCGVLPLILSYFWNCYWTNKQKVISLKLNWVCSYNCEKNYVYYFLLFNGFLRIFLHYSSLISILMTSMRYTSHLFIYKLALFVVCCL